MAVFVAADKQLLASAQAIDKDVGGAIVRAIGASRFTGAKGQSLTVLGQSGGIARLSLLGVGKARNLMRVLRKRSAASLRPTPTRRARRR